MVTSAAVAQDTAAKQETQTWFKICPERKLPDNKIVKICVTQHEQFNPRSGELNVAVAIRQHEGKKDKLLITVPLGVALPTGVAVQFDKIKDPLKFTYVFCHREGCVIDTEATPQILDAMRKGGKIVVSVFHTLFNRPVSFDVSLKGFTKSLEGGAVDANQYFQKRQQLRLFIKKRTQEEIKKLREEQQKKQQQGQQ